MRLDIPQNAILLPYIDPIMGQMWMPSGTRAMRSSISCCDTMVPVGLLGLAMKTIFVRGVMALSIAGRSCRKSRIGTVMAFAW